MFNITINDADGFDSAIFSLKNSSGANWYNYSALRISGISYDLMYNITISSNSTQVLSWRYYFNDSSGTMYNSAVSDIVISDTAATWSQNGTNATIIRVNDNIRFNLTINDADGFASYIFSLKNSTGANWYNYSAVSILGRTNYFINTSHTISSNATQVLSWKYYFNDSSGTMYNSSVFNIVIADTYATWSRNGTNFTSIKVNENGMFNVTVNDADELSRCIFSLKNSTNDNWYNYSALDVSGSSYDLRYNISISSNKSQTLSWRYYCNDSSGTMYNSSVNDILISDYIALFSQNGTNFTSIRKKENAMFNITVRDDDQLAMYIFSLKNSTNDEWYNYSAVSIGGNISYFINVSHSISSTNNQAVQWRYYVNDTNGTMYDSGAHYFTVDDYYGTWQQNGTNFT